MQKITYYTDASYSPTTGLGVVGWSKTGSTAVKLEHTKGKKCTEAEVFAVQRALEDYLANEKDYYEGVIVYSDCQKVFLLFQNRTPKKEQRDPYIYELYDRCGDVQIIQTKGHSKKKSKSTEEQEFSEVDKAVRAELRELVQNQ